MSSPWKQPQCLQLVNRPLTLANVVTMETHLQCLQLCRVDRMGYDGGGVGWDGDGWGGV